MPYKYLQHTGTAAGIVCILLGLTVLAGWWFDIASLKTVLPGLVSMKANTALCFFSCRNCPYRKIHPHQAGTRHRIHLHNSGSVIEPFDPR